MNKEEARCPFCSETIKVEAIKCRFCNEWIGEKKGASLNEKKVKAKNHPSYNTFTLLGILLPFIGIIVGIVYLTKEDQVDKKLGEHAITTSILGFILGFIIIYIMNFKLI